MNDQRQPDQTRSIRRRSAFLSARGWGALAAFAFGMLVAAPVLAEPSVEDVKAAGEQFNLGRTAFKEGEFAVAAEHFERADGLAPNPKVLELAIEARVEAGQMGRAGMLAELAKRQYPGDERFAEAESIIKRAEKDFARVEVTCDQPCNLVIGMRLIHGPASTEWVLFLEEGEHSIRAGFGEKDETKDYTAHAGEVGVLEFAAPADESPPPVTSAPVEPEPDPFAAAPEEAPPPPPPHESKGLSPTWFWVGAGTTVALAGVSTWSAIDTVSSPGEDAVRAGCQGQGQECQLYQEGLQKQSRTNLLWGITGVAGVATVVIFALTDWGTEKAGEGEYADSMAFEPWFGSPGPGSFASGGGAPGSAFGIGPIDAVGASARGSF